MSEEQLRDQIEELEQQLSSQVSARDIMILNLRALMKRCADALVQYKTYRENGCLSCDGDDPGEECTCGAVDIPMHVEHELRRALR